MTKEFIARVKREGIVDTKKYRYVYKYITRAHVEYITRLPIMWVDTAKALNEWEWEAVYMREFKGDD